MLNIFFNLSAVIYSLFAIMTMCANDEYDFISAPVVILVLAIKSVFELENISFRQYNSYFPQAINQYILRRKRIPYYSQYKDYYKHIVTKCKRNVTVALDKK